MKNIIFKQIINEFQNENFEVVFNVIWNIFENNPKEFKNIFYNIIEIFNTKAYLLRENDKIIHFTDWNIPDKNLLNIIEITSWDNITKVENHIISIIDSSEILSSDRIGEIDNGIYVFRNYYLFEKMGHSFLRKLNP